MRAAGRLGPMLFASLFATARDGHAQDREFQAPPPPAKWAVGFNPLAVIIGRYSADLERLVTPDFALLLNIHGDYASRVVPSMEYGGSAPVWGFGAEIGCRWFTAGRGMHGFFMGSSLVAGWYSIDYYGRRFGLPGIGPALDMGGQVELGRSAFLGFGGGMQYLWTSRYPVDIASGLSWVMGAGINTRVLLTIGALLP
ncbi:MAG: hypothetical protein M3O46_03890 [Myxococcota bacterium]|nr:hypothetical protein [Myxococcota bacterium]